MPRAPSSKLHIRTALDGDAGWATDVHNAANPDDPHDVAYTKWIWSLHLNEELGYVEVPGHVKFRLTLDAPGTADRAAD